MKNASPVSRRGVLLGDIFESNRQDLWTLRLRSYGWKTPLRHHLPDPGPRDSFFLAGAFFFDVAFFLAAAFFLGAAFFLAGAFFLGAAFFLAAAFFFGVAFLAICAPFAGENYPRQATFKGRSAHGSCQERAMSFLCELLTALHGLPHLVATLENFQVLGVDFDSYTQQIDTTMPAGKLTLTVLAAFAEFERKIIRERVKW
jgi:hypothetical protein